MEGNIDQGTVGIPLRVLKVLLQDKATGQNIVWATDHYADRGEEYAAEREITPDLITGANAHLIQPRVLKTVLQQADRTRKRGEVFTPAWVCNKMNNALFADWFDCADSFNRDVEGGWATVISPVRFPEGKTWREFVDLRALEITCGEAPFLVSRYDSATGQPLPIGDRIGLLDRKLRVVGENAQDESEWLKWAFRAVQSIYGYEYQGDNLLLARLNILHTFRDYLTARWEREPALNELLKAANIISWNLWQMDGLKNTTPIGSLESKNYIQLTLFGDEDPDPGGPVASQCKTFDWRAKETRYLSKDFSEGVRTMKFDFVIGNPPYQESGITNNKAEAIYPYFYDGAETLAEKYILISPARFLFNAGLTPKKWNLKMLSDKHLRVVQYFHDSSDVFSNTNINGGVVIIYRDSKREFAPIGMFVPDDTLRSISDRFKGFAESSLSTMVYGGRSNLKFNDIFLSDYPDTADRILRLLQNKHPEIQKLGPNEEYELKSSSFERTPYAFLDNEPTDLENYYKILGIEKGRRVYKWVLRKYMSPRYPDRNNIEKFKVLLSNADGAAGQIGKPIPARIIGKPIVAEPGTSAFPTFMSIGDFDNEVEARYVGKYIQTKFVRVLLGVLKVTQHITPTTWEYVPLQNFTENSDIDWSKSIPEIDQQLYKKYSLTQEEIDFIESHVKEMV